uniref:hypothetical protein n=1 Tax=Mesorhizobium atlanticum TaxID=2233532 RepID=UPI0037041DFE
MRQPSRVEDRLYGEEDPRRLAFIRQARELKFGRMPNTSNRDKPSRAICQAATCADANAAAGRRERPSRHDMASYKGNGGHHMRSDATPQIAAVGVVSLIALGVGMTAPRCR